MARLGRGATSVVEAGEAAVTTEMMIEEVMTIIMAEMDMAGPEVVTITAGLTTPATVATVEGVTEAGVTRKAAGMATEEVVTAIGITIPAGREVMCCHIPRTTDNSSFRY